jgi:hypothetical protein
VLIASLWLFGCGSLRQAFALKSLNRYAFNLFRAESIMNSNHCAVAWSCFCSDQHGLLRLLGQTTRKGEQIELRYRSQLLQPITLGAMP